MGAFFQKDDPTVLRQKETYRINSEVITSDKDRERSRLESKHSEVLDTRQMQEKYDVTGFGSPYVVVVRKSDNVVGSLEFQHAPRFYFNFQEK